MWYPVPTPTCTPRYVVHGEQGSADYSEYGYEPEFDMKSDEPPDDEELLEKWRLER